MFKKFINGLVLGAGFASAFIAVVYLYFKFINISYQSTEKVPVTEVPTLSNKTEQFYGSSASFSGQFIEDRTNVLAAGDSMIVGAVKADGKPAVGLKLRLGLNGKVMSQWTVTDKDGNYYIRLPAGEYRVDGYELDYGTANNVLAGLIDMPSNSASSEPFTINKKSFGLGIELNYVKPVIKKTSNNAFRLKDKIIISWQAYDHAAAYDIQIYEKSNANDYSSKYLLPSGLKTTDTFINVTDHLEELKEGFYYHYDVRALDVNGLPISLSYRDFGSFDFKIIAE